MRDNFTFLKKHNKWLFIFFSFIMVFFLLPLNFEMHLYPLPEAKYSWQTLDPSWVSTLNYVSLNQMIWGEDFAFTFGPLSYLLTRVGWGHHSIDFLLFDIFVSVNFFLIFYLSLIESKFKSVIILFIVSIVLILPVYLGALYSFILLGFLIFWIIRSLDSKAILPYFFQIILVGLLFFIKLNTGIISIFFFTLGIVYKIILKKDYILKLIGVFLFQIIFLYCLSFLLHVDIFKYIKSALEMVSGYNDIMHLEIASMNSLYLALIMIVLLFSYLIFNTFINYKANFLKRLLISFIIASSVFILFKQGFVRADESHIRDFFYSFLFLALCVIEFSGFKKTNKNYFLLAILPFLTFLGLYFLQITNFNIKEKIDKSGYYNGFQNFSPISSIKLYPSNNKLPVRAINKIGLDTIDSYPWNTQILLENKLIFQPRPVFQSYITYTSYLQEMNFNYYNSNKAPKYVLYDYDAIDNRYPLFDDSKMNLVLLKNYKCVDTFNVNNRLTLLLEKKSKKKINFVQQDEYAMYLNDPIIPKKDIFYKVYLYENIKGKMISTLFRGPNVSLKIILENGEVKEFRTSVQLLEAGIFSDEFISNTHDFNEILSKKTQNKIIAYYFEVKESSLFKDKIRIKEFKID